MLQLPIPSPKRCLPSASPVTISSTPGSSDQTDGESIRLTTPAGEACFSHYSVHELPSEDSCLDLSGGSTVDKGLEHSSETQVVVNTALVACIEALEAEAHSLRSKLSMKKPLNFRLENIAHSDSLVCFYTGFSSTSCMRCALAIGETYYYASLLLAVHFNILRTYLAFMHDFYPYAGRQDETKELG